MRDTLIAAAFLAAIASAYWVFQKSGSEIATTGIGSPTPVTAAAQPTAASAPTFAPMASAESARPVFQTNNRKAFRHERNHHSKSEKLAQLRNDESEGERAAGESVENPQLPSLYSGEGAKPAAKSTGQLSGERNWHGVPVTAWLESRRSALPHPPVAGDAPSDLRLFFQCMELKKDGPREIAERECRKLRAGLPTDEIARQSGLPGSPIY